MKLKPYYSPDENMDKLIDFSNFLQQAYRLLLLTIEGYTFQYENLSIIILHIKREYSKKKLLDGLMIIQLIQHVRTIVEQLTYGLERKKSIK